jgi:hypothetical protein
MHHDQYFTEFYEAMFSVLTYSFFSFSLPFFFNPKHHLYERKHIETPGTPELPRDCRESVRQLTGEKLKLKKSYLGNNAWCGIS